MFGTYYTDILHSTCDCAQSLLYKYYIYVLCAYFFLFSYIRVHYTYLQMHAIGYIQFLNNHLVKRDL